MVRGEDGGVRAREALERVEAILAQHGVGWSPPVPARVRVRVRVSCWDAYLRACLRA